MSEDNKTILREIIEEVYNKDNASAIEESHARDFVVHHTHHNAIPFDGKGPDIVKQINSTMRKALPDLHYTVDAMLADGDLVAVRWTGRGTHKGEYATYLGTVQPTGNRVTFQGTNIFRLSYGKIVEQWISWDRLGFFQQIGAAPETSELLSKDARK